MEAGALRTGDPERLGGYTLSGRLGEGGQGTVFLGTAEDGRRVAVKLLHPDLTADERARGRFLRELEVAKRVAGFCTAQVIDADVAGDRPYIVSEYVPGPSLARLVGEQGTLAGAVLDRLAIGTVTALVAIHRAGIVHRDFKPHNVLIGPDGPRVIDFGVARAISGASTVTSRVVGTPAYMAPEQLLGEDVGTAADVFCWAATMVFAATGRPPFGQDTIPAVIHRILHVDPDLGDMTGPLADLVAECLAKEAEARPRADALLMRLLGHEAAPAAPAPALPADSDATALLAQASEIAADLGEEDATRIDPAAKARPAPGPVAPAPEPSVPEPAVTAALPPEGVPEAGRSGAAPPRPPSPREWAERNGLSPVATHDAAVPARRGPALSGRPLALAAAAAVLLVVLGSVAFAMSGDEGTWNGVGSVDGGGSRQVSDDHPRRTRDPRPGNTGDDRPAPAPSSARPTPTRTPSPLATEPAPSDPAPDPSGPSGGPSGSPADPDPSVTSPAPEPTTSGPATP